MNLKQNQHLKLDALGRTLDILWSIVGVRLECFGMRLDVFGRPWVTLDNIWRQFGYGISGHLLL